MNSVSRCRAEPHIGVSAQGQDADSGHAADLCSFSCGLCCGIVYPGAGLEARYVRLIDRRPAGAEYPHSNHEQDHDRPADMFGAL